MHLRLLTLAALLAMTGPAGAQCYNHGYSYSYPTYSYQSYSPTYVPVAVAYPLPVYGSTYTGGDYSVGKELKDLKRELELEKIKQEIAALKGVAQPVPQQSPAPQYAPPQQPQYQPPARESAPAYDAPPVPQQSPRQAYAPPARAQQADCKECNPPQQAPQQPAYAPSAPPRMQRVAMSRGQFVGQQSCASCHTPSSADEFGGGRQFFNDDMGLGWNLRPQQIDRVIAAVKRGTMPPKESGVVVSPADRAALVQHLETLKAQRVARND